MSRIGRRPVDLPEKVTATLDGSMLTVQGPLGKLDTKLPEGMSVKSVKESQIENLFIVDIGDLQPIYASKNGEFFFYGELYAINGNMLQNTTKDEINLNY